MSNSIRNIRERYEFFIGELAEMSDEDYKTYISNLIANTDGELSDDDQAFVTLMQLQIHDDRFMAIENKKLNKQGLKFVKEESIDPNLGIKTYTYKVEKM